MCSMTSADFPLFLEYFSHCCPKFDSEGPCSEFILSSDLQQLAKVNLNEINPKLPTRVHKIVMNKTKQKRTRSE